MADAPASGPASDPDNDGDVDTGSEGSVPPNPVPRSTSGFALILPSRYHVQPKMPTHKKHYPKGSIKPTSNKRK